MSGRLFIVPVGLQPAAALVPLLSPPFQPEEGDEVLLMATEQSFASAGKVQRKLQEALRYLSIPMPTLCRDIRNLDDAVIKSIWEKPTIRSIWFLANGSPVGWTCQIIREILSNCRTEFRIGVSRGAQGVVLDARSQRIVERFDVKDLGIGLLLDLLDLEWNESTGILSTRVPPHPRSAQIDGVLGLHERAGQLFAEIDATGWADNDKKKALSLYRKFLNWRPLQQDLGLETRRVVLVCPKYPFDKRALQDGIPFVTNDDEMNHWRDAVHRDEAASWPERDLKKVPTPRKNVSRTGETWTNGTLVVAMGTQPGATLQAIFAHAPKHLVLLYDGTQPLARLASWRLQQDPVQWGCETVDCICAGRVRDYGVAGLLTPWKDKAVHVNVTPGDRLFSTLLLLWALSDPGKRTAWTLDGPVARRLADPTKARHAGDAPLQTWLDLHAPAYTRVRWNRPPPVWSAGNPVPNDLAAILRAILQWIPTANSSDLKDLARLWTKPKRPLYLEKTDEGWRLRVPGMSAPVDLTAISSGSDFEAAMARKPPGLDGKVEDRGEWWEWVVGWALMEAGADEVKVNFETAWDFRDTGKPGVFRDQLDVVVRSGGQYSLWSCKTQHRPRQDWLLEHLEEARTQADRLLGRRSLAVLVVPSLAEVERYLAGSFQRKGNGHFEVRGTGHVVDARLLVEPSRTLNLLQTSR